MTTPFSVELRRLRTQAGLSQSALAERAGLSPEAISLLERGRRSPRLTTIRLLATALLLSDAERARLFAAPLAAAIPRQPVPRYGNLLVGRAEEIEQALSVVSSPSRLLTLTGPGGVGKTRLAVEVATAARKRESTTARWVDVMACEDEAQLVTAVASALRVGSLAPDQLARSAPEDVGLLILDGAEPLVEAVRAVVELLLGGTTGLRVLVTSRERLRLRGEELLVVAPLACTPRGSTDTGAASPAGQLFLARASRVAGAAAGNSPLSPHDALSSHDVLSPHDAVAVARICARVDGIPLAIELAASRTALLSVGELSEALDEDLSYLYRPHADDEVQLRKVMVGDSFPRLSEPEQNLLASLSLFSDSFTAESAAAVGGEPVTGNATVDTLSLLVSKSLVLRTDRVDGAATFRLLRVVREYAGDRLSLDPTSSAVHGRYACHFRDLAARAAPHLTRADAEPWSVILDAEADNVRRAFRWCLRHDPPSALSMVESLVSWWRLRGHYQEGRASTTAALAAAVEAPPALVAAGHTAIGLLSLLQCDYEAAQAHLQQGLDLYSCVQDRAGLRRSLALLGEVATQRGEYTVAGQLHEQALVLARRSTDAKAVAEQLNFLAQVSWLRGDFSRAAERAQHALEVLAGLGDEPGVVLALVTLGVSARYRGDLTGARTLLSSSLRRSDHIDYREGVAWSLNQLGVVSRLEGDLRAATDQQSRSLLVHRRLGSSWRAASALDELAALALAEGDAERATAQLGAAAQLREDIGAPVPAAEQPARDRTLAAARAQVGTAFPALSLAGLADCG